MNENVRGLAGAAVGAVGGLVTGYIAGAINNPKPPVYKEPEPICGCNHHISYHDDNGCHASSVNRILKARTEAQIEQKRDKEGIQRSKTLVPAQEEFETVPTNCGCKKYTGPEPLPTYINP